MSRVSAGRQYAEMIGQKCKDAFTYTFNAPSSCNGWGGLTAAQCRGKCETNAKANNCPTSPTGSCAGYTFWSSSGWCHLYSDCSSLEPNSQTTAYRVNGGIKAGIKQGLRVSRMGPFCLLSGAVRHDRNSQKLLAVLPDTCRPAGRRMYNLEATVRVDITKNGDVQLANPKFSICITGAVFRSIFPDAECTKLDDHLDNAVLALGGQPKHVHRPHTHTPHRHHRHVRIEKHVSESALWRIPSSWTSPTHRHSAETGGIAPMTQSPGWKHNHGPLPVARANFKRLGDNLPPGNVVDTRLSNTVDTLPQHRHTHQHSPQHRHVARTRHPTFMTTLAPSHGRTPSPTMVPTVIPTPPTAAPTLVPTPPTSAPTFPPFSKDQATPAVLPTLPAPRETKAEEKELNGASCVFQICVTEQIVMGSVPMLTHPSDEKGPLS